MAEIRCYDLLRFVQSLDQLETAMERDSDRSGL
jgi:hypothetical protein